MLRAMISHYYFLDWVAMALSLLGMHMLGSRDHKGFVLLVISNAGWIVVGLWAHSLAIVLGNVAFLGVNLRGWLRWRATHATPTVPTP
jgi:hypothetical protein